MSVDKELTKEAMDLLQDAVLVREEAEKSSSVPKCTSWRVGRIQGNEGIKHHWLLVQHFIKSVLTNANYHKHKVDFSDKVIEQPVKAIDVYWPLELVVQFIPVML